MTPSDSQEPPGGPDGVVAGPPPALTRTRRWVGNALVGPVIVWVAMRWSLRGEREAPGVAWPAALEPVPDPEVWFQALWSWGLGLLVAAVLLRWMWARWARPGTLFRQRALWCLLVLWVAVWLGGTAAAWRTQANQKDLQAARTVSLKVIAVQKLDPSARSEGGARVFLEWPEQGGLHRVVLSSPSPELLASPPTLTLTVSPGRWQGWFVTGWSVADNGPSGHAPPKEAR